MKTVVYCIFHQSVNKLPPPISGMQHFCKFHWITRSGVRHSSRSTKSVEEVCLRSGEKYNKWAKHKAVFDGCKGELRIVHNVQSGGLWSSFLQGFEQIKCCFFVFVWAATSWNRVEKTRENDQSKYCSPKVVRRETTTDPVQFRATTGRLSGLAAINEHKRTTSRI